jgi:hypothetical protein
LGRGFNSLYFSAARFRLSGMPVCLRCGYDLRATPSDAACPECGLAAHRSVIEHSHPDDCRPRWVGMIAAASVMLLVSYVGVGFFLIVILTASPLQEVFLNVLFYILLALAISHAVGNFLIARDDRRGASKGIWRVNRWLLRILPLFPIAGLGMFMYGSRLALQFIFAQTPPWIDEAIDLSYWLILSVALCPAVTFFRLRWLALRLSRPKLAEHVTIVAVGCTASLALLIVCVLFEWGDVRHADISFFLLMVLPAALVALFDLWATLLLFVVSRRFLQSAREARARWNLADASRGEL